MTIEEATEQLETAITEYLSAVTEDNPTVLLEGYVLQMVGKTFSGDVDATLNGWTLGESQPVHVTLGLTEQLRLNVRGWYEAGGMFVEDDDD